MIQLLWKLMVFIFLFVLGDIVVVVVLIKLNTSILSDPAISLSSILPTKIENRCLQKYLLQIRNKSKVFNR